MQKINWARVVLGGMLSGVALMILAAASAPFLIGRQAFATVLDTLRPSAAGSGASLLFFVFVFLFLGVLLTSAYAAIRSSFGPGLKTAALAGFAVWLTGVWLSVAGFVWSSMVLHQAFPLPQGPLIPCLGLMLMIVSTAAGAWVCNEQQVPS